MPYGTVINSQDVTKWLQQYNKNISGQSTFGKMYTDIGLASKQAEASVQYDMAQDVADAYAASLRQKSSIYSNNYRSNIEQEKLNEVDIALQEAYQASISARDTQLANIRSGTNTAVQEIDKLLQQQTEKYVDYTNKHFDYLTWLDTQIGYEGTDEYAGLKDTDFANYYDAETGMLLDRNKLYSTMFTDDALNTTGLKFFDLVENYYATHDPQYSLGSYLSTLDKSTLAEWAAGVNQYDYDTELGRYLTNAESYRKFVGLDKSDTTYTKEDTVKYSTDAEFDKLFDEVNKLSTESIISSKKTSTGMPKYSYTNSNSFINSVSKLAKDYKISMPSIDELTKATNELTDLVEQYNSMYNDYSDSTTHPTTMQYLSVQMKDTQAQIKAAEKNVQAVQQSIVKQLKTSLDSIRSK